MFVLLLIGALWSGWYAYRVYSGINQIVNQPSPRLTIEPKITIPPINGDKRINILVLGSDNDKKKEEAAPLAQSMIVVTIDPYHYSVSMLSIPRDFWVKIPGHGYSKIDLAYKYGGAPLARAVVEKYFKIPIHHFAWVGLTGFTKVIDTFGGINLDITHPILDDFYPNDITAADPYAFKRVFIPEGWRHLSGRQALEYVRSRHGDAIGDFGRSSRQQQVLSQLRQKLTTFNVLTNLPSLVDDLTGEVKTDLSLTELYQLEELSHHIRSQQIQKVVLQAPTYSYYDFASNSLGAYQSILRPRWNLIRPIVKKLFAPIDTRIPRPAGSGPLAPITLHPTTTPTAIPRPGTPTAVVPTPTATPRVTPTVTPIPPITISTLPARLIFINNGNVAEMSRDGTIRDLTGTAGLSMPAISQDGKSVAYVRWHSFSNDIEVINRSGSEQASVPGGRSLIQGGGKNVHDSLWSLWPQWTSDGKFILYSSDRQKRQVQPPTEARATDLAIWSMPASGGNPVQVTVPDAGAGGDTEVQSRPHTSQFVYVHWAYDAHGNPYSQLVLKDLVSGISWGLTPRSGRIFQPQFDVGGNRIVYIRDNNGTDEVDVSHLVKTSNGFSLGRSTVLATGQVAQPAFTPGGKWVSYLLGSGNSFSLYIAPSGGGPSTQISAAGSNLDATSRPIWIK